MMSSLLRSVGVAALGLLAVYPSLVRAQTPPASTLFIPETETQFSLNIANDSSTDIYLYFTSPAYSWVGVGFGEGMKNSLMFIMYPTQDGNNVTISPRIAAGHSEPSFARDIQLETLPGTTVNDSMFILKARCRNCREWSGGSIDIKHTAHPMIYAFGPGHRLQSNALDAPLKRHIRYGRFNMDLTAATGKGGVPLPTTQQNGVTLQGDMTRDHDRANLAHAVMGCLALFVLWPVNVILAGFFKRIRIHLGMSVLILIFLISAFGLGIAASSEYNRSKTFRSPHQILAFLSLAPTLVLSILPLRPIAALNPKLIPRLHAPLASATLVFLILTGGLGLNLSSQCTPIVLAYTALALLVAVFCVLLQSCIRRRGSAYQRANRHHRVEEEDEQDLVLAAYYANRKLEEEQSRTNSAASLERPGAHARSPSGNIYGGGTMPGPQYLMNMHPGVPVHRDVW